MFPLSHRKAQPVGHRIAMCEDCDRARRAEQRRKASGHAPDLVPSDVPIGSTWRWERPDNPPLTVGVQRVGLHCGRVCLWLRPVGRTQSVTCQLRLFREQAVRLDVADERRTA